MKKKTEVAFSVITLVILIGIFGVMTFLPQNDLAAAAGRAAKNMEAMGRDCFDAKPDTPEPQDVTCAIIIGSNAIAPRSYWVNLFDRIEIDLRTHQTVWHERNTL